jgi:hypothetical protein
LSNVSETHKLCFCVLRGRGDFRRRN